MKRRYKLSAVAAVIILVIAALAYYYKAEATASAEGTLIGFDHERAFADEKYLTSLGPRLAGTNVEAEAALYVKQQFEMAGLSNVVIEEYPAMLFEVMRAEFSMVDYRPILNIPDPLSVPREYEHTVEFVVQGYSGSRLNEGDLEWVDVGSGSNESDYDPASGKAAIVHWNELTPRNPDVHRWAWESGAESVILVNDGYGEEMGYLPIFKTSAPPESASDPDYPDIPMFMVSKAVGEEVLGSTNTRLRINFDVTIETRKVRVVVGEVKGTGGGDDFVMLGAHHDTVYNGQGAVDNTVGAVTVMEVARQLAKKEAKRTIRFATWGGEEEGLFGSRYYAEAHAEEIEQHCRMYLNFDMNHVDLERDDKQPLAFSSNDSIEAMGPLIDELMREPELKKYNVTTYWSTLTGSSDQAPFVDLNVTVASAWGSGSLEYHTYLDTIDRVNPESLQLAGRLFGTYALQLARA